MSEFKHCLPECLVSVWLFLCVSGVSFVVVSSAASCIRRQVRPARLRARHVLLGAFVSKDQAQTRAAQLVDTNLSISSQPALKRRAVSIPYKVQHHIAVVQWAISAPRARRSLRSFHVLMGLSRTSRSSTKKASARRAYLGCSAIPRGSCIHLGTAVRVSFAAMVPFLVNPIILGSVMQGQVEGALLADAWRT